jgi:hypothetical protein
LREQREHSVGKSGEKNVCVVMRLIDATELRECDDQ